MLVVVLFMGLFAPLARADTTTGTAGACSSTAAVGNQVLPVFRCAQSSGTLHSIPPVGVLEGAASIHLSMQRSLTGTVIGLGNPNYVLATTMADMASSFCPLQQFGYVIDSTVKTVGDSIIGLGLLAAPAVFAVVGFIRDRARHQQNSRQRGVGAGRGHDRSVACKLQEDGGWSTKKRQPAPA